MSHPSREHLDRALRRRGQAARRDLSIRRPPRAGRLYARKPPKGSEIHYPHLPLRTLTTLEEARRAGRPELAPPISTAGLKVGRMADEDSDLISSAEAGEILGVSRFRVNAMVAFGRAARPPRQRQDSRRSRRCGAEGRPRPPRGTSREVRQPFPVRRASRRTHAICG